MGDEIATTGFHAEDFSLFARRLAEETEFARAMFADRRFSRAGFSLGFEIEAWIVDHNSFPRRSISAARSAGQSAGRSRAFAIQCRTEQRTAGAWRRCARPRGRGAVAALEPVQRRRPRARANMVMIGTLPTIRDEDLTLANISPLNRYYALNKEVLRRRRGRPLRVDIEGRDHLVCEHRDVMLEAATTSFQFICRFRPISPQSTTTPRSRPPAVARRCGNSPLLFAGACGRRRAFRCSNRRWTCRASISAPAVSMGTGYLERSCLEIFEENLRDHPPLLPISFEDAPESLHHLRLHNGTIWRWNRPLSALTPTARRICASSNAFCRLDPPSPT